jgi:hypothetical protein
VGNVLRERNRDMGEKYIWFNGENGWEDPRDITILVGYREIKDDA